MANDERTMFKVRIPPDLSRVRDARLLMEQVASLTDIDTRRLFDLQVVVSEACVNAIEHAGTEVDVVAWVLSDRIVIEISSESSFQTRVFSDDHSQRAGVGLPLMAALADQVQVSRLSGALTRVSLTFLLEPEIEGDRVSVEESPSQPPRRCELLEDPHVHAVVLTPGEIREKNRLERELTRRAFHDPLTGLANRGYLFERGEEVLRGIGQGGRSVAVLLLDVDRFKEVNDTLGHEAGDRLLATVGARLRSLLRPKDIAARLGGDEFVLLIEDGTKTLEVGRLAERILSRLREPYDLSPGELRATFSMGVAVSGSSSSTLSELLREADIALYSVKSERRDGWKLFETGMLEAERAKRESEGELRRALESDAIVTHFQPVLSTDYGTIVGFEALVRWNKPEGRQLLPENFLGLAEESGLIVPLGYELLERSCIHLRDWDARHPRDGLKLMVNLSSRQLRERDLVDRVEAALTAAGVSPDRLVLEIVEDVLADGSLGALENVDALRTRGVKVALDDFGTGSSSITGLKEYPIDILKLAPHLVEAAVATEEGALLVAAVVGLAGSAGLQVVGEGVEKSAQLEKLRLLGCEMWQGRYFSPPVPPAEVPGLLQQSVRGHNW